MVPFHDMDDNLIYVNPDTVCLIRQAAEGGAILLFTGGWKQLVQEKPATARTHLQFEIDKDEA
jgi:hypothetical protein